MIQRSFRDCPVADTQTSGSPNQHADLHAALAAVARAIAGSLEVRSVWDRIHDACRTIVPHDALGIVCLEPGGMVRAVAAAGPPEVKKLEGTLYPRAAFSPRFWPDADRFLVLVDDVETGLDMSYPADKLALTNGYRSVIRLPLGVGDKRLGSVLLCARERARFTREHAQALTVVAELVTVALAHDLRAVALADETRRSAAVQERAAILEQRVQTLAQELETLSPHRALGASRRWRDVLAYATKVAPTDTTVLLSGESGTGKEVVARFIHRGSPRKDGPFVALNCAALPDQLLESELFGHEKGAFTGALASHSGKIEQAARGVLFLDEVGEMSPSVQAKFLRVLQEREFQKLGGTRTLRADVRVLAATNRDLKAMIVRGTFREDLYYRLAVFDIALPPLRERPDDIALLTDAFLETLGRSVARPAAGVAHEAREKLLGYAWPGNVRELRNVVERALILCEGGLITSEHLPLSVAESAPLHSPARVAFGALPGPAAGHGAPLSAAGAAIAAAGAAAAAAAPLSTVDAAERDLIVQALARSGNNKSKAARLLGLTRAQLRSRIEKHGIAADGP
jgi:transcriptional regulator with GAF, ATPase, and Fis domain